MLYYKCTSNDEEIQNQLNKDTKKQAEKLNNYPIYILLSFFLGILIGFLCTKYFKKQIKIPVVENKKSANNSTFVTQAEPKENYSYIICEIFYEIYLGRSQPKILPYITIENYNEIKEKTLKTKITAQRAKESFKLFKNLIDKNSATTKEMLSLEKFNLFRDKYLNEKNLNETFLEPKIKKSIIFLQEQLYNNQTYKELLEIMIYNSYFEENNSPENLMKNWHENFKKYVFFNISEVFKYNK